MKDFFLRKNMEIRLCSLCTCKVKENIKHLLLDCNKENLSSIHVLRDTCVAYKMYFNIKNVLDVGCTQNAVFRLVILIRPTNGTIVQRPTLSIIFSCLQFCMQLNFVIGTYILYNSIILCHLVVTSIT